MFNAMALMVYANGVRKAFGQSTAIWYVSLQASQFHIIYYASRTLPNMFAFGLSMFRLLPHSRPTTLTLLGTIALRFLLPDFMDLGRVKRTRLAIYLLTTAAVIFRGELALLIGCHCLHILLKAPDNAARASLIRAVIFPAGMSGAIAGLVLTVSIDTFFWQSAKPLWPEFSAFMANIFPEQGNQGASEWGTSPWHWYFTSALPRLFVNPIAVWMLFLSLITPWNRTASLDILVPNLGYVALYSFLPHKETRFLFPVIPSLATVAALAASNLQIRSSRSIISRVAFGVLILSTLSTFLLSHFVFLPLSSLNYPGAVALKALHSHVLSNTDYRFQKSISIYLDNLACQSGVTKFLQMPSDRIAQGHMWRNTGAVFWWRYDKSEIDNATDWASPELWNRFDYAVLETPATAVGEWNLVETVYSLSSRPTLLRPGDERGLRVLSTAPRPGLWSTAAFGDVYGYGYGEYILWLWDCAGDVLREGQLPLLGRVPALSLTRGWWIEPQMVEQLYIMQNEKHPGRQDAEGILS